MKLRDPMRRANGDTEFTAVAWGPSLQVLRQRFKYEKSFCITVLDEQEMENKHFLEKKEQEWNELRLANCTRELSEFEKWDRTKELVEVGQVVIGKVTEHREFGFFLDIGFEFPGLVIVANIGNPRGEIINDSVFPEVGVLMETKVLGFNDLDQQVTLYWEEVGCNFAR